MVGLKFCPTCRAGGLTSKVTPLGSETTLMACYPFYDEQGRYHDHDMNTVTARFACSKGHGWTEKRPKSCWCGWEG